MLSTRRVNLTYQKKFFLLRNVLKYVFLTISIIKRSFMGKQFFCGGFINPYSAAPGIFRDWQMQNTSYRYGIVFWLSKILSRFDRIVDIYVKFLIDWEQFQLNWANIADFMGFWKL